MKFKKFFLQRVLAWALTILIGVTFIFFIPRMFPSDPVENMIAQIQSRSGNMDPAEMDALRSSLRVQFGLVTDELSGAGWKNYRKISSVYSDLMSDLHIYCVDRR